VANTYLGGGISIPHGMLRDRNLIKRTGIAVLQVPGGLEWNPGEEVRLVVGIAAASDEHLQILANLTQVLNDEPEVERLATTSDSTLVVERLSRPPGEATPSAAEEGPALEGYASVDDVVEGASGLHARPATAFVDVAKGFRADVRVRHDGKIANGKSLASLLALGADTGSALTVLAKGPDQEEALRAQRGDPRSGARGNDGDRHGRAAQQGGPTHSPSG